MERIYKIYRINHKIEGELQAVYIGHTSQTLRSRLINHLYDKNCKFGQYWLAYTSGEYRTRLNELEIIELDSTTVKGDALEYEEELTKIAINVYGDICKNGNIGNKHSDETKKKIGEANKGHRHSDEAKKKMGEASKGSKSYCAQPCEYDGKSFGCITEAYEYAQERGYTKTYEAFRVMIKKG